MKTRLALLLLLSSCKKDPPPPPALEVETVSTLSSTSASPRASEPPARCRIEGPDLPLGEDTVVGDALVANGAIHLGVTRKRTGSILKVPFDLSSQTGQDIGPVRGEDPPPSPRLAGASVLPVFYTNLKEAGASRELAVGINGTGGNVSQQADESTAFDVAFPAQGPAVVAWDEDAPIPAGQFLVDRGQIRVQLAGETEKARVASPFASDAEAPHLALKKGGGFWLAWIAKKIESPDAGDAIEGPGEKRAFRWIELVALDAKANVVGAVKRITPEKGRVVAFDLLNVGPDVVAITQDEAALVDGAGGRIVRYAIDDKGEAKGQDLLEGGVGHAIADIVPPWVAWTDVTEHAHLLPLAGGMGTREPLLDGARVVAAEGEKIFAIAAVTNGPQKGLVLRGFVCRK